MSTVLVDSSGDGRPRQTPTPEDGKGGLGELLRRARERRGLTLEQLSNETKIPLRHLVALEENDLTVVPGEFYRRAQIRTFARVVQLDPKLVSAHFEREPEPPVASKAVPETSTPSEPLRSNHLLMVLGFAMVAAMLLGAILRREPAGDRNAAGRTAADAPHDAVPPLRQERPDAVVATSRTQPVLAGLPSTSDGALAMPGKPTAVAGPAAAPVQAAVPAPAASPSAVVVTTEPAAATPASADSTIQLVVTTQPEGAHVTVNGIGWGTAPVAIRHLPAGDKRVRVSKEGYATEERVVRVSDGRRKTLDIRLRSAP